MFTTMTRLHCPNCNIEFAVTELSFNKSISFRQVTRVDFTDHTPRWRHTLALLAPHETSYPDILKWAAEKVGPQLGATRRPAYIAYANDKPVGLAIGKSGVRGKICHLSVVDHLSGKNIGTMFMSAMLRHLWRASKQLYFTIPAETWDSTSSFFEQFGFFLQGRATTQYRTRQEELICTARRDTHAVSDQAADRRFRSETPKRSQELLLSQWTYSVLPSEV